jgi:hypothetical protein
MSDAIPPALTPEEWAGDHQDFANDHAAGHRASYRLGPDCVVEFWTYSRGPGGPGGHMEVTDGTNHHDTPSITIDRPNALAALALHGQPLGFTRFDVQLLRHYAKTTIEGEHFSDLADRIDALLPPRIYPA